MGTSGAYGGSNTGDWQKARETFDRLLGAGSGGGTSDAELGGDDRPTQTTTPPVGPQAGTPPDIGALAQSIAAALRRDDPLLRLRRPPRYSVGSLLPMRGGGGGGGAGAHGRSATGGRAGARSRRQVLRGAARGGNALAAGLALRAGDRATLAELGLDLDQLTRLGARARIDRIIETVLGDDGHPDDHVIKKAVAKGLAAILGDSPPTALETVRIFVVDYVFGLALVEIKAQLARGDVDPRRAATTENELHEYLMRRSNTLVVADDEATLASLELRNISARLTREALSIVEAGAA